MAEQVRQARPPIPSASAVPRSLGIGNGLGHIMRRREPANFEFPFPNLDTYTTPNTHFYIRSHFPNPDINVDTWRLKIEGAVGKELEFSFDDLKKLPSQNRMVTLECAGNGRGFLVPRETGDPWELGAVSNAHWTGVALTDVLAQAGIAPQAVAVIFEGADEGQPDDPPRPPGKIHYARAVPLSRIDDVLLACEMNGEPLPLAHGAPLRAVVGGWYGMASVKWLTRIVVSDRPFRGYFETVDYAYWEEQAGMPVRVPIGEMKVKAQISRPATHEVVPIKSLYRVVGAAWAGDCEVAKVEVSTDGGQSFAEATLLGEPIRHAWRFWEYEWTTPSSPGSYTLMARATDSTGERQPSEREKRFGNYVINHTLPVNVELK